MDEIYTTALIPLSTKTEPGDVGQMPHPRIQPSKENININVSTKHDRVVTWFIMEGDRRASRPSICKQ